MEKAVATLLAAKPRLETSNALGETALMLACIKGNVTVMVRALLQAGASVNSAQGWSPLMYAAYQGNAEVDKALLAKGASIDAINHNGTTALMLAARQGHVEVIDALLNAGADLQAVNKLNESALDFAHRPPTRRSHRTTQTQPVQLIKENK